MLRFNVCFMILTNISIEIILYLFSGPSSINPETNKPYGSSFPILSVEDFVRAQFQLVKYLGIEKV